jgi:TPR repeat protein
MKKFAALILCLLVSNSHSSTENDCDKLNTINKKKAYEICLPLAINGNANAQFIIGSMYDRYGLDGKRDNYEEAMKWYKLAANQGLIKAQITVGSIYQAGYSIEQDSSEALKWYLKAADKNNPEAQHNIGEMYCNYGLNGFSYNFDEAVKWHLLAAKQGYEASQIKLGKLYEIKKQNYT